MFYQFLYFFVLFPTFCFITINSVYTNKSVVLLRHFYINEPETVHFSTSVETSLSNHKPKLIKFFPIRIGELSFNYGFGFRKTMVFGNQFNIPVIGTGMLVKL
jgi:hypothetical protein